MDDGTHVADDWDVVAYRTVNGWPIDDSGLIKGESTPTPANPRGSCVASSAATCTNPLNDGKALGSAATIGSSVGRAAIASRTRATCTKWSARHVRLGGEAAEERPAGQVGLGADPVDRYRIEARSAEQP